MAKYSKGAGKKVEKVMHEMKQGKLRSGSGKKVTSRKQAVAIGLSEAREEGAKVPRKSASTRSKSASKKSSPKKAASKTAGRKSTTSKSAGRKTTTKSKAASKSKTATKKSASRAGTKKKSSKSK